jgi:hypothetical protein
MAVAANNPSRTFSQAPVNKAARRKRQGGLVVPLPLFYIFLRYCHGRQGQGVIGSELRPLHSGNPLHQMMSSGEEIQMKINRSAGASIVGSKANRLERAGTYRAYRAYRAHDFPGLRGGDAAETHFPSVGHPPRRRADLMRIVRLVRTFFQNQQPLPAQKGISSSVISVPANSSCCTGAR